MNTLYCWARTNTGTPLGSAAFSQQAKARSQITCEHYAKKRQNDIYDGVIQWGTETLQERVELLFDKVILPGHE